MFQKIRICLCHPKYIAMYYKEKASKIALLIVTFFLAFAGIVILCECKKDFFTNVDNQEIVQSIVIGDVPNLIFDAEQNKFIGNQATYKSTYYNVYFLPKEKINFNEREAKTSIIFDAEKVTLYYSGMLIHQGDYQSELLESFDLALVKDGDIKTTFVFSKLLTVILNDANQNVVKLSVLNYIVTAIFYYFGIVLSLFLFTILSNPTIGKGVRFKLCCLDSLIFIAVFAFQVMLGMPWLLYVGVALPILYSNFTFLHIVRKVN